MGVEQFVYRNLGRSPLQLAPPVAAALDSPVVDWITQAKPDGTPQPAPVLDRLVLRSGCRRDGSGAGASNVHIHGLA